jgi:hypothetical protein
MNRKISPELKIASVLEMTFVISAGSILLITGAAKLWSAFGQVRILEFPDPITNISFRHLMLLTSVIEMMVALVCLLLRKVQLALILVAWLATIFLIYRLGLWWLDWQTPCHCLGSLTGRLGIPSQTADTIMKIVLAYLLIGSYIMLWFSKRRKIAPLSVSV